MCHSLITITWSCDLPPQALLFRVLCFVASVLGLLFNPFFFSLHLLNLVWSSTSLQNVLKSVMLNYKQVRPGGIPSLLYCLLLCCCPLLLGLGRCSRVRVNDDRFPDRNIRIYVPDIYTAFQSSIVCIVFELEGVRGSGIPPATTRIYSVHYITALEKGVSSPITSLSKGVNTLPLP